MVTTIQLNENTLNMLKQLKAEMEVRSYEEAISRLVAQRVKGKSFAGSLKKYLKKGETAEDWIEEIHKERRQSDRY